MISQYSKVPACISLMFLICSYIFSFWRAIVQTAAKLPTTGGIAIPNTLTYDGLYAFGWAMPLFISVSISMYIVTLRGFMHSAVTSTQPHRVVNVIIAFLIGSNVLAFIMAMITKYALPRPSGSHGHHGSDDAPQWTILFGGIAGRAAMPAFYNVGWSLITAMRHPALNPLQSVFGLAYEHTIVIHRALGWLSTAWLSWHSFGYLLVYIAQGNLIEELDPTTTSGMFNLTGLIAFISLIVMAISSSPQIRRPQYTIFMVLHGLWISFFFFSIFHIPSYFLILLPPLFLYLVDRLACVNGNLYGPMGSKLVVATLVRISDDAFSVLVPVGPTNSEKVLDIELTQIYEPGRFVSLALANDLPGVVPSHPFSIASYSVPNQTVCIIIRVLGPWTKRVHSLSTTNGSFVKMLVAGPFSTSALSCSKSDQTPILIAGGVGISKYIGSPIRSLVKDVESIPYTDQALVIRKVWMCKDVNELNMYVGLGADLNGWDAFCSKGFQSANPAFKSFPMSAQSIHMPLSKIWRLSIAAIFVIVYVGLYMASRYTLNYDPAACARVRTITQWILCGRGFGLVAYAYILLGIPIISVLFAIIASQLQSVDRGDSTFICHSQDYSGFEKSARRFNLAEDVAWSHGHLQKNGVSNTPIIRSCTSKPIRNSIRALTLKHKLHHVNDGIGF